MPTLDDELLAHQINSIKHGAAIGRSVRSYLDEIKQIIRKRVAGFDSDTRTAKRLEKMLDTLAKEISKPAGEWRKSLEKQLKEFATYEIKYQTETISEWVGVNLTEPTFNQVWTAAKFNPVALSATNFVDFAGWLKSWEVDEVSRLVMGVKSGFVDGLTVRQILKNVVGAGGLSDVSERNAMTMARTMTMHLASEARFETYKENDDIIDGYQIVATLDKRTSDICRSYDGQKFYFTDEKQPKPIFHANCRTTTKPILSSEFDFLDKGAKRPQKGAEGPGQTDADVTYYSWLKTQPAAFQDEILGQAKGAIFRNSGLDAEEFRKLTVDDLGKPLTLTEMQQADSRIAKYMRDSKSKYAISE